MKKLITIICLLMVVLLCASCGKNDTMTVKEYIAGLNEKNPVAAPNSLKSLDSMQDYEISNYINHVFVLKNNEDAEQVVYNAKTGTTIFEWDLKDDKTCFLKQVCGEVYIAVLSTNKDEKTTTILYTDSGEKLLEVNRRLTAEDIKTSSSNGDFFVCDGRIYNVKDGKTTFVVNNPFVTSVPSYDVETDSYYYDFPSSNSGNIYYYYSDIFSDPSNSVIVYDKTFNVVLNWECPYGDARNVVALNNDTLIAQLCTALPEHALSYDFLYMGTKWKMDTIMIDVATGKEKSINLDYAIMDTAFGDDVSDSVENIAAIRKIEGKNLSTTLTYVSMGEKGKVVAELFGDNSNCDGIELVANGKYLMYGKDGYSYLVGSDGAVIGRVSSTFPYGNDVYNDSYIMINGVVYDYNLNNVYNPSADGKTYFAKTNNSLIFKDSDNEYYLLTSGSTTLTDINGTVSSYNVGDTYFVAYKEGKHSVYGENGNKIGNPIESDYINLFMYEGGCLITTAKNGKYYYYRLSN